MLTIHNLHYHQTLPNFFLHKSSIQHTKLYDISLQKKVFMMSIAPFGETLGKWGEKEVPEEK